MYPFFSRLVTFCIIFMELPGRKNGQECNIVFRLNIFGYFLFRKIVCQFGRNQRINDVKHLKFMALPNGS